MEKLRSVRTPIPYNPIVSDDPVSKARLTKWQQRFQEKAKEFSCRISKDPAFEGSMDFDTVRGQRRATAVCAMMETAQKQTSKICPDVSGVFSFEDDWLEHNLMHFTAYDYEENQNHLTLACAIWMLDRLREQGITIEKSADYPSTEQILKELQMPAVWDAVHDEESIATMLWIIRHRNDDCTGLKIKQSEKTLNRFFMDKYTTLNMHRQDVASRNRFEDILDMIPEECIAEAVSGYLYSFWHLLQKIYASRAILVLKQQERMNDIQACTNNNPLVTPDLDAMAQLMYMQTKNEKILQLIQASRNQRKQQTQNDWHRLEVVDLRAMVGSILQTHRENREDLLSPEINAVWDNYRIPDPYGLSFGFLYLLDRGSDVPWVYSISLPLMQLCASVLPWNTDQIEDAMDEFWEHYEDVPVQADFTEFGSWFAMNYENTGDDDPGYFRTCNLAQLVYWNTNGILPRRDAQFGEVMDCLGSYGEVAVDNLIPLLFWMDTLHGQQPKYPIFRKKELVEEIREIPVPESATTIELQQKIKELISENKQLRQEAYADRRETADLQKELEQLKNSAEYDRQELIDLRELVFHLQENTYFEEPAENRVEFPYTAQKRIVVFGGHDSWSREIKALLPTVRFIDRSRVPDAQLIRHADIIWIQTNALCHGFYYKIIDEVRKYHIPVRYFTNASAAKCAEQVALHDMSM